MEKFKHVIDEILDKEKGYVNDPNDRGGETNFGITVAVARANRYTGEMKDMPESFAREVYLKRYILAPKFDLVHDIDQAIGDELIDTGVNMGTATAAMFLQRCLNSFRSQRAPYGELFVDGAIGTVTLGALRSFLDWRGTNGKTVMLRVLNGVQATRYVDLSERDNRQREFTFGWILNRVVM